MIQKPLTAHEKRQFIASYIRHLGYKPDKIIVSKIGLFTYGYKVDSLFRHVDNYAVKYARWRGIDGIKIFIYRKWNRI